MARLATATVVPGTSCKPNRPCAGGCVSSAILSFNYQLRPAGSENLVKGQSRLATVGGADCERHVARAGQRLRTIDELALLLPNYFVAESDGKIIGCAALEIYSSKLAELRKIARNEMGRVTWPNRKEVYVLLLVLGLALAMRTIYLSSHPYPWSGDEASIGSEAARILRGEVTNLFETGWSSQPNWSFIPAVITEAFLGQDILAVRLTSVVAGTLAVLFVFLAGRELFNSTVGLAAAAFLATLAYHMHFSRVGVNNVVDSLMSSLVFWLLAVGVRKDDARYYYTAGAAAGLCLYTYVGTRLVIALAVGSLLFLIIRNRGYLAAHWKHLGAFAAGGVLSGAGQMAFFARHPAKPAPMST